ncbi:MAG: type II toxin-antitoxin system RelE/ParE family toxin [Thiomicrorhabdus sp.]|jgi:hypothetical protein|nr:type II toxin-antitoxin system RelE/ParE family toxin [Thiomicrorhabdus sp.]
MKKIFKTTAFNRWLKKSILDDESLCEAVQEMERGLFDVDLGAGLYKKRVALGNRGKSAGARTLIATNLGSRWFFVYGFVKSQRSNINDREKEVLKLLSEDLLSLTDDELSALVYRKKLMEICNE